MPGDDIVLTCETCGVELDRGDHLAYSLDAPTVCDRCAAYEAELVDRAVKDEYDEAVRQEEQWKADRG